MSFNSGNIVFDMDKYSSSPNTSCVESHLSEHALFLSDGIKAPGQALLSTTVIIGMVTLMFLVKQFWDIGENLCFWDLVLRILSSV